MAPKGKSAAAMERQARAIGDMNSKKSLNAVNTAAALAAARDRAAKDPSALGGPAEEPGKDTSSTTPGVAGDRIGKKTGGRGKKKKKARSADPASQVGDGRAEGGKDVSFARVLAHNDLKVRNRGIKKLRQWLSTKKSSHTELELLKLWKGLFYCMWMSDKPLVQQELAQRIASLFAVFPKDDDAVLFFATFWQSMQREWQGIDRLRMDKFYDLIDQCLLSVFRRCAAKGWQSETTAKFIACLQDGPLALEQQGRVGIALHIIEKWLVSLSEVDAAIPGEVHLALLSPFSDLYAGSKSAVVRVRVKDAIFDKVMDQAYPDLPVEGPLPLGPQVIDYMEMLCDELMERAKANEGTLETAREALYKTRREIMDRSIRFQEQLEELEAQEAEEDDEDADDDDDDTDDGEGMDEDSEASEDADDAELSGESGEEDEDDAGDDNEDDGGLDAAATAEMEAGMESDEEASVEEDSVEEDSIEESEEEPEEPEPPAKKRKQKGRKQVVSALEVDAFVEALEKPKRGDKRAAAEAAVAAFRTPPATPTAEKPSTPKTPMDVPTPLRGLMNSHKKKGSRSSHKRRVSWGADQVRRFKKKLPPSSVSKVKPAERPSQSGTPSR